MPDSQLHLSAPAARVLGSLLEKETTTPEYYPLSLLALTNACNQRTSRHPVMELSEDEVRMALHELEDAGLAAPVRGTESRVAKFAHHIGEVFNLRRGELAVLCVLLLRGAQTPGELRSRTDRMHNFTTMDEVESTLQQLAQREPPLARAQPREPGAREMRYAHLLSPVADAASEKFPETSRSSAQPTEEGGEAVVERIATLENEVVQLRTRIASVEDKLAQLLG
ncbi:MAG TPA: YceH family protein [Acidobacteriaceae bacterium]|nr:YceH family protein [Acidobacteriaceae bacterium]